MKGLLLAIQFLSIIPVRIKGSVTQRDLGRSGMFFPVVGMIQGLAAGLAALFLIHIFSEEISAGLVVLILIVVNGGFHLDGLADTFDAIAVKSSGDGPTDRERRLAVMKDSLTGAIGVTAIVMAILLKYLFICSLLKTYDGPSAALILFLMPLFSKWAALPALFHGKAARSSGLGKTFIDETGVSSLLLASLIMITIYSAAILSFSFLGILDSIKFLLLAGTALYLLNAMWSRFCGSRFGGLTGDNLGAAGEMSDLLYLGIACLWL